MKSLISDSLTDLSELNLYKETFNDGLTWAGYMETFEIKADTTLKRKQERIPLAVLSSRYVFS